MAMQLAKWEIEGNVNVGRLAEWHTSSWRVGRKVVRDVTNMANLTTEDMW